MSLSVFAIRIHQQMPMVVLNIHYGTKAVVRNVRQFDYAAVSMRSRTIAVITTDSYDCMYDTSSLSKSYLGQWQ